MSSPLVGNFSPLRNHKYIRLVTFRRNGRGVATPVWFAISEGGDKLYAYTLSNTGKLKRIRRNPKVEIAPSAFSGKPLGLSMKAEARVLSGHEILFASEALDRKYGIQAWVLNLFSKVRKTKRVYLEITPSK